MPLVLCGWSCAVGLVPLVLCRWSCVVGLVSLVLCRWSCAVGLVLQLEDAEKFPQALGLESLVYFFFRVSKQGPCFTAIEEEHGSDKRLVHLEP